MRPRKAGVYPVEKILIGRKTCHGTNGVVCVVVKKPSMPIREEGGSGNWRLRRVSWGRRVNCEWEGRVAELRPWIGQARLLVLGIEQIERIGGLGESRHHLLAHREHAGIIRAEKAQELVRRTAPGPSLSRRSLLPAQIDHREIGFPTEIQGRSAFRVGSFPGRKCGTGPVGRQRLERVGHCGRGRVSRLGREPDQQHSDEGKGKKVSH